MPGLAALKRKLERMPKEARREIRKALEKGAYDIAETARSFAPVDDGTLRDSIDFNFGGPKGEKRALAESGLYVTIHAGGADAFYAPFVEFGTAPHEQGGKYKGSQHPGTPPRPFFYPAYRANKKRVKASINRAIRRAAKTAAAGN